jgi:hypothetical protein
LAENVENELITFVTLIANEVYCFKVTARNAVGDSEYSEVICIRAAELPEAPINLANIPGQTTASQIGVEWTEGLYSGGSPIIDFDIYSTVYKLNEDDPDPVEADLTYTLY